MNWCCCRCGKSFDARGFAQVYLPSVILCSECCSSLKGSLKDIWTSVDDSLIRDEGFTHWPFEAEGGKYASAARKVAVICDICPQCYQRHP